MFTHHQVMVEPREPPTFPKPHISDIGQARQVFLENLVQHTFYNNIVHKCLISFVSDFLATVSVLLSSRVKLCVAPAAGRISLKLCLRGFNPHSQDWICLRRGGGGGGGQGVADQLNYPPEEFCC